MSIQIFSRDHWTNSVCATTSKVSFLFGDKLHVVSLPLFTEQLRGFKVGLALEFEKWFIAFLTLDLVFQVCVLMLAEFTADFVCFAASVGSVTYGPSRCRSRSEYRLVPVPSRCRGLARPSSENQKYVPDGPYL